MYTYLEHFYGYTCTLKLYASVTMLYRGGSIPPVIWLTTRCRGTIQPPHGIVCSALMRPIRVYVLPTRSLFLFLVAAVTAAVISVLEGDPGSIWFLYSSSFSIVSHSLSRLNLTEPCCKAINTAGVTSTYYYCMRKQRKE